MLAIISIAPGSLSSLTSWGALSAAVLIFLLFIFICAVAVRFYRKVDQGTALIINKLKSTPDVTFTGGIVIPILYKAEEMDISVKAMEVNRTGANGLICATTSVPTSGCPSMCASTKPRKTSSRSPRP